MIEVEEKLSDLWETELKNEAGVSEKLRRMPIPGEFYDKSQVKAVLLVVLNAAVILACVGLWLIT